MQEELPNLDLSLFDGMQASPSLSDHKPRILLLYGSTRERSFSRLSTEEAARLLAYFGAETRLFNPSGLPLPDDAPVDHPKVQELRELVLSRHVLLYAHGEREVVLLSLKHERQMAYKLAG
jgi:arsenic resistance protein ArsH